MIAKLIFIQIAFMAFTASANPIEFRAEYRGNFVGFPVKAKAVRELGHEVERRLLGDVVHARAEDLFYVGLHR